MSESKRCILCDIGESTTKVPAYRIDVCKACWDEASKGWPASAEPALFNALARQGLLIPDRNLADRLPRQYAPPKGFAL